MTTTQEPLIKGPASEATGWKVTFETQYAPWLATVGEDDARLNLAGVHIEADGWAVATNGFILAVVPCVIQAGLVEEFVPVTIPGALLKQAQKLTRRRKETYYEVQIVGDQARFIFPGGGLWTDLVEAADFPNWRALLPSSVGPSKNVGIDAYLVSTVAEAIGASTSFPWLSGPEKGSPFVVEGPEGRSLGLVMPIFIPEDAPPPRFDLLQRLRHEYAK